MSPLSHMKYMLLGGAGVVVVALLFGVPLQSALFYGVLLACPLMMIFMMGGHGEGHDDGRTGCKNSETQQSDDHRDHTHKK
ncbi:MAG: DUF2933 domain-containing protein [Nocardioidaceae bacterium]